MPAADSATPRWSRSTWQAIMGIPSDRRFLAARRQLGHLFPHLPSQSAYFKRRRRLSDAIECLLAHFRLPEPRRQR